MYHLHNDTIKQNKKMVIIIHTKKTKTYIKPTSSFSPPTIKKNKNRNETKIE